jgi:phosphate/sulfate permease|tara:strand:+ start:189 stop:380 length:192 start_codon:yes stop_codon:yes gene_type:complete
MTRLKETYITSQSVFYTIAIIVGVTLTIVASIFLLPVAIFLIAGFILFVIIRVVLTDDEETPS